MFCGKPGAIWGGQTGDVACDHYHRRPEDVRLMKDPGIRAYRFSIAWTRILPAGTGAVNRAGLDVYGRLVDELFEAGIEPWVTPLEEPEGASIAGPEGLFSLRLLRCFCLLQLESSRKTNTFQSQTKNSMGPG